ncbi:unnamed protein product [Effrenium voratum]|nr:unnamed protein product [Effrenium voratum]
MRDSLRSSQDLRLKLLPSAARRWALDEVMESVRHHEEAVHRVPMFAYTLLPGVNDSEAQASELVQLMLQGRPPGSPRPFVNLVPYNATMAGDSAGFAVPSSKQLRDFRSLLRARGLRTTVRWSTTEGRVLGAACGQLAARERPSAKEDSECPPVQPPGEALLYGGLLRSEPACTKDGSGPGCCRYEVMCAAATATLAARAEDLPASDLGGAAKSGSGAFF